MDEQPTDDDLETNNFNLYVGSSTGVLKGVYFGGNTPILKNFSPKNDPNSQDLPSSITSLSWGSEKNKSLLVGFSNGNLRVYNPKLRAFTTSYQLDVKSPLVRAFSLDDERIVSTLENGRLSVYSHEKDETILEINTGQHLSVMRQLEVRSSIVATGGKENDLKIFDLSSEKPEEPVFKARNVRHDFLDLRVPVWVQDLTFVNNSSELVATCSRHGQARIYDVRAGQRPQIDFKVLDDEGLMAICDTGQSWQVIVGGNKGTTASVDLRYPGKGKLVHKFSAASGSVRSLDFRNNFIVSGGLDRHLYVYNLYEKKAVKKLYLKTRLTQVIMTEDFRLGRVKKEIEDDEPEVIPLKRLKAK
ncbi:unnamed protein product [Allacma fusca]|uniref:WD repeat-containing protein 74 n=1 Tax=Allacma fusca TaxID=39272 RepID=A0A8J2M9K3_9HEXA|nr:unnamed protein product [Allacma fusca]